VRIKILVISKFHVQQPIPIELELSAKMELAAKVLPVMCAEAMEEWINGYAINNYCD